MEIRTIKTGSTLVSSAVPDRSAHRWPLAYTRLFQSGRSRIKVPVKCFYVSVGERHVLIDTGWSIQVTKNPKRHLGAGLYFASEPVMDENEAAVRQLLGLPIDRILMTHLDCDHVSGVRDFRDIPVFASRQELNAASRDRLRYGKLSDGLPFRFIEFWADVDAPFGLSSDIFGDGSITAYLTPTHSAGSVIYKITEGGEFALIVGDNGYKEESWKRGLLPGPIFDAQNMKKCLSWIDGQGKKENCRRIYCAHDPVDR